MKVCGWERRGSRSQRKDEGKRFEETEESWRGERERVITLSHWKLKRWALCSFPANSDELFAAVTLCSWSTGKCLCWTKVGKPQVKRSNIKQNRNSNLPHTDSKCLFVFLSHQWVEMQFNLHRVHERFYICCFKTRCQLHHSPEKSLWKQRVKCFHQQQWWFVWNKWTI